MEEKKIYVARLFTAINPIIVENFPATTEGYNDAVEYAKIMKRNKNANYVILVQPNETI